MKRWVRNALAMLSPRFPVLARSLWARPRAEVGAGAYVDATVHFIGSESIRIGRNTVISEGSWLNVNDRNICRYPIDIHENCFIGRRNFFSSGASIEIMPYTLTALDCKFLGSSHVVDDPYVAVLTSGTTTNWRIRVGVNCFVGAGSTLLGNVTIGHGSVVGAMSLVTADVPPFSLATGSPAKVIKRYSHARGCWVPVAEFSPVDIEQLPDEPTYLGMLRARFGELTMPLAAAGRNMGNL